MTEETSGHEHVEIDQQFLDMLAGKFTAKQLSQDKSDPTRAANTLATMLANFYKELRRCGVPKRLTSSLTLMLLQLTMGGIKR